jgi:ribokinase
MVGCVGDDLFAALTRDSLASHGVRVDRVRHVPGPTGVAHIRVDASGQNDIVITPLANAALDEAMVDAGLLALAPRARVLLLQLEVRPEITAYAAAAGRRAGLRVVLDPAPAATLPTELWPNIDVVTPNETEATAITGTEVTDADSAERAARWFLDRGVGEAIITIGDKGAVSVDATGRSDFKAFDVEVVDTTAAGDAFTGTFGAAIALGRSDALSLAMAAGALAVTKPGASASLPTRDEITALA